MAFFGISPTPASLRADVCRLASAALHAAGAAAIAVEAARSPVVKTTGTICVFVFRFFFTHFFVSLQLESCRCCEKASRRRDIICSFLLWHVVL